VRASRNDHGIAVYQEGEREARGEMTLEEAARALGVSKMTVHRLIQRKQLPARQACAGAPWIIRRVDVDAIKPQAGIGPGPLTAHPNQLSIHFQ
jgi:excisionase family DNA binding protein